jgi:1,4-alpha-glucan branching enzyme
MTTLHPETISAIVNGLHGAPFDVLGCHPDGTGTVLRTFQPQAQNVTALPEGGDPRPMERIDEEGFFEAVFPDRSNVFRYRLKIVTSEGENYEIEDPYRFPPILSEEDLYLFNEGNHFKLYEKLGAQLMELDGVPGVCFSVWAPTALRVSVVGHFNRWDGRRHPMRPRGASGVWELFIPGLGAGEMYKYEIKTRYHGYVAVKADPFGFAAEVRPNTASVVADIHHFDWRDQEWMANRRARQSLASPVSIYEVHLGSWRRAEDYRSLTYSELAETLVPYAKEQGFTHLELLPITEHPYDGSWGYQTVGYFAPTSRFGAPAEFAAFVDAAHRAGLGIILDWVPAHFPKDGHGLSFFDGTHLYEHEDPRLGEHADWGTYIFNFGRNEVSEFLLNSALFWLDKYHLDGLRVDAVASMLYLDYSRKEGQWLPNKYGGRENLEAVAFLKRFNELTHEKFTDILTFAEESTAWPMVSHPTYIGGLGFDLKWNMGWMHDMLLYMSKDPVHRRYHHNNLTFSLLYAFTENFTLPLSHDEVVHGKRSLLSKMPGDYWQQFANLRALYAYMFAHPGKKLLFMGAELGQWIEWNDGKGLDWNLLEYEPHRGLQTCLRDLNRLYASEKALHEQDFSWEGFQWIDFRDVDQSIVSFLRRGKAPEDQIVVVANFTPVPRHGYRVGVPQPGLYREIFNSDSSYYYGSNVGNVAVPADEIEWQSQPYSMLLTLPPLGVVYFKREGTGIKSEASRVIS